MARRGVQTEVRFLQRASETAEILCGKLPSGGVGAASIVGLGKYDAAVVCTTLSSRAAYVNGRLQYLTQLSLWLFKSSSVELKTHIAAG